MTPSVPVGEVRYLGDRALVVGVADAAAARRSARALEAALDDGVEVVCGLATVTVHLRDTALDVATTRDEVLAVLRHLGDEPGGDGAERPGPTVVVPCVFDGPDLGAVASFAGCTIDEVVSLLTGAPLTVAVLGFSPGFAYLGDVPDPLRRVPRRAHPRPVVPAGSVAMANGYAAVYPTASPGGWQLVGRTGFSFFSVDAPPYAALAPGDRVQFVPADGAETVAAARVEALTWAPPPGSRAVFEVDTAGIRSVLQDGGRHGVASAGVPGAGPADPVSFLLANRLVGNRDGAGVVEVTGGPLRVRCLEACHVAVVGADPVVRVDGTDEPSGQVLPLAAGQRLGIGPLRLGLRTYVAVAGGLLGPMVVGSIATDQLSGLGPGPLSPGQRLHAGAWAPPLGDHLAAGVVPEVVPDGDAVALRVVPGPHPEWFTPDALERLASASFTVDGASNRVGLRLRPQRRGLVGPGLRRPDRATDELDSQGGVTGAVQVPPGGEPVVLLPDHATLGGYPVLAVVVEADHGLLGQCAPGTTVRFTTVDMADASESRRALQRRLSHAVVGHYPLAVS